MNRLKLSFAQQRANETLDLWPPCDDLANITYDRACQAGRDRADELVNYIRETSDAAVLGMIVLTMPREMGGMEAGFWQRIGETLR